MNNNSLTTIARKYVGIKGFAPKSAIDSRWFRYDLRAVGWVKGDDLDMAFARMCYTMFYGSKHPGIAALRFRKTYASHLAIKHSPYWITHLDTPQPGDLMFCRYKYVGDDYYVCIIDKPIEGSTYTTTFETPLHMNPNWEDVRVLVKNGLRKPERMKSIELVFFARLRDPSEALVRYGDRWERDRAVDSANI